MIKLDTEITLAFILFELTGLYLIILIESSTFNIIFTITTILFALSTIIISYLAFSIIKQIRNFTKILKNIN